MHWVYTSDGPTNSEHLSVLESAVRSLLISASERVFLFIAGEASVLKPIRRYLRRDVGLAKEQIDVSGYWKKGVVNPDHHLHESPEDE